ncbi:probable E3 ubiquitin-protein ligase MID2 isoform X2 [Dicentrarchus labrax]|nr:probable E3 ubiquitin-protein ligase MID2 isoform X2 [Dicentrarchus labrax]
MTAQSSSHGSSAAISSVAPVEGIVELREEEMEQSVFGLCFSLDSSTVPPSLHLSNSSLTITYHGESPPGPPPDNKVRRSMTPDPRVLLALPQICADVVIARGQYYWEVDVCNSSVYRIGVSSLDGSGGWWLQRQGLSFCAVYDGSQEPLCTVPPQIKTLGVFLNIGGGTLSFYNPLTQEHIATLPTRFHSAGVLPALGLGQGRLRLRCGLPPPPHVFLSKDSAYRGSCGAGGGRWRREIPFQSVRKVIQKFEELAVSDSDSGLVSSFGSSCSTLVSLPDLRIPGMFPSGQAGQETGAE